MELVFKLKQQAQILILKYHFYVNCVYNVSSTRIVA